MKGRGRNGRAPIIWSVGRAPASSGPPARTRPCRDGRPAWRNTIFPPARAAALGPRRAARHQPTRAREVSGSRTGKRAIALGTMSILSRNMQDVAIFRPIINEPQLDDRAPDINLLLEHFKLKQDYCDTFAYTYQEVRTIINQGDRNLVIENIIQKFKELQSRHDFVLCVGTDFLGKDPVFEFELNAEIASNLGCPVMLITSGEGKNAEEVRDSLLVTRDSMAPYSLDVIATIVNRSSLTRAEADDLSDIFAADDKPGLVYAIPDEPALGRATMRDLQKGLNAEVLSGEAHLDALVGDYLIAAMHVDNFLGYLAKDQLIVTPGDRTDILLASIASRLSSSKPDIAGVLLTGGIRPSAEVSSLIEGWTGAPLPVLLTEQHTSKAFMSLQEIYGLIEPTDTRKINTVLGLYDHYVNGKEISARLNMTKPGRMTPMMFELNLIERAKANKMRIVLAEGEEPRILQATDILLRREVADIILLGNADKINKLARELHLDISKATIIDPVTSPKFEDYAATYAELRKAKGVTIERARDVMSDATYYATMMVKKDDADGMVSGAVNTTAHTIRPAFEFIKTKPGYSVVSSVFLMCLKDRVLTFGDCAINPDPPIPPRSSASIPAWPCSPTPPVRPARVPTWMWWWKPRPWPRKRLPSSPWKAPCSTTPPSIPPWPRPSCPTARWPARRPSSSSPTSTPATTPTRLCSVPLRPWPSVLSCRASTSPSTTCPAAAPCPIS